jgi:hypothetical protein
MLWFYRFLIIFNLLFVFGNTALADDPFRSLPICRSTTCESVYDNVVKPLCRATKRFSVGLVSDGHACRCFCTKVGKSQDLNLDIAPMIHPSRRFIQFYVDNHEDTTVLCRYIKVSVKYEDIENREIGMRQVTINQVVLEKNVLKFKIEAGKEIIENLEMQYDQPRIHSIYGEPKYDCFY